MPKALCLISLVASILVVVLFLADMALGMLGMKDLAPLQAAEYGDGRRVHRCWCSVDFHELDDVPRATLAGPARAPRDHLRRTAVRVLPENESGR